MRQRWVTALMFLGGFLIISACGDSPVDPIPVATTLTISGADTLHLAETLTLQATVRDQHGEMMSGQSVHWTSSNTTIASVDASGRVTPITEGTTSIQAVTGSLTAEHAIRVLPASVLVLSQDSISFDSIGAAASITGTIRGAPVSVALGVNSESRWNADLPVATVSWNMVTANAAGISEISATANGLTATLHVRVAPERPYVAQWTVPAIVSEASPLIAQGYGLAEVASDFLIDGVSPSVRVLDSARVALALPPLPAETCKGPSATVIPPASVDLMQGSPVFNRSREGEVSLTPGETRRLTPQDVHCLKVGSGEYALAFYDAQFANIPQVSVPFKKSGNISVSVTYRSSSSPVASSRQGIISSAVHVQPEIQSERPLSVPVLPASLEDTTTPWRIGDIIDFNGQALQVTMIIDGYEVIAVEDPEDFPKGALDSLAANIHYYNTVELPRLEDVYGLRPGVKNGQILWVVAYAGPNHTVDASAADWIVLFKFGSTAWSSTAGDGTIAHEMTHSFDFSGRARVRAADYPASIPYSESWQTEGVASAIENRAVAHKFGYDLNANAPLESMSDVLIHQYVFNELASIEGGYWSAAAWMWRLSDLLVEATGWTGRRPRTVWLTTPS